MKTPTVIAGVFLTRSLSRSVVQEIEREAWWQWGEINRGGRSHVDLTFRTGQVSTVVPSCTALIGGRLMAVARGLVPFFGHVHSVEGPNLLRYRPGDFVAPHPDEDPRARLRPRRVTVVAFLNDRSFGGGILSLRRPDGGRTVHVAPRAGLFVAFPSPTIHAVSPTTHGNRYALVAWLH